MSDTRTVTPVVVRMLEGRVGSTLVMQLLGTSEEICFDRSYPYEHSYLTYLARLAAQLDQDVSSRHGMGEIVYSEDPNLPPLPFPPEIVERHDLAREALSGLWSAFSRALFARGGARLYAEKFWGDVARLRAAGIDPYVVDLVRDPRDVVASVRAFNTKTGVPRFGRERAGDDAARLVTLVAGMAFRLRELTSATGERRILVRYEDLVQDLGSSSAAIGDVLGVDLDPRAVVAAESEMSRHITAPSVAASVGRWRSDLAEHEVAAIERRLGRAMESLGYELATR